MPTFHWPLSSIHYPLYMVWGQMTYTFSFVFCFYFFPFHFFLCFHWPILKPTLSSTFTLSISCITSTGPLKGLFLPFCDILLTRIPYRFIVFMDLLFTVPYHLFIIPYHFLVFIYAYFLLLTQPIILPSHISCNEAAVLAYHRSGWQQEQLKVFWSSGRPLLCFSRFGPFENVARIRRVYVAYSRTKNVHTRNLASNAMVKCVFVLNAPNDRITSYIAGQVGGQDKIS